MKVGNLVISAMGGFRARKNEIGIVTRKEKPRYKGGLWHYRVVWPDGSIVFHTRGTLEVINENRQALQK
jgi:hypothetical protein